MQIIPVPFPVPIAPPPGTPEWIKILVTALASLTVGILLEPLRAAIQYQVAERRTHTIVAKEINEMALLMLMFLALRKEAKLNTAITQKPEFSTERYDYACDKNREHLYLIASWDSLRRFYQEIKTVGQKQALTDDDVSRLLMEFALFEDRVKTGILGKGMKSVLVKSKISHLKRVAEEYRAMREAQRAT